jgi:YfiH family protein
MPDPTPKRRRNSSPKNPDSEAANPEKRLNFPENESNPDIGEQKGRFGQTHPGRKGLPGTAGQPGTVISAEPSAEGQVPARAANGVEWFPVPGWEEISWLWHGFSTRRGGVTRAYCPEPASDGRDRAGELGLPGELNLGFTAEDDRDGVIRNRRLLAEAVTGNQATPIVTLRQVHSSVIVSRDPIVDPSGVPGQQPPPKGDGLMTRQPGFLLGIQTADCIPVLVADRRLKAVAAFHAGWRGTVRRIVENGIGRMRLEFGSQPEDLVAAIGPGIGACCYAVGEEVISEFESQFTYGSELFHEVASSDPVRSRYPLMFLNQRAPGHGSPGVHLDLIEANRRQLLSAGLQPGAVQVVGACTNCHPEMFFSYRASKGKCGRMMSVIGIR